MLVPTLALIHTRARTQLSVVDLDERTRLLNDATHREALQVSEHNFFHVVSLESRRKEDSVSFDCYSFPGAEYHGTDATAPVPFGEDELARVSRSPLLSAVECASVVAEAESNGAWSVGGRSAAYASRAGSTFSITSLPNSLRLVNERLLPALLPAIAHDAFPSALGDASMLRLQEARLVKYNASAGQTELGMHRDGPFLTATVALNAPSEYGGGGTMIEALGKGSQAFRVGAGCVVLHPGNVRHGGAEVRTGVRYVLVCFIFDCGTVDHDRFCLLRANALLRRALRANRGSEYARDLLRAAVAEYDNSLLCGNADKAESAHVGLGQALLELGEPARALRALEAALEAAPCNAHVLATLATAREAIGDRDGACTWPCAATDRKNTWSTSA